MEFHEGILDTFGMESDTGDALVHPSISKQSIAGNFPSRLDTHMYAIMILLVRPFSCGHQVRTMSKHSLIYMESC